MGVLLSVEERVRLAELENAKLRAENQVLQEAIIELADIMGGQDGEVVSDED